MTPSTGMPCVVQSLFQFRKGRIPNPVWQTPVLLLALVDLHRASGSLVSLWVCVRVAYRCTGPLLSLALSCDFLSSGRRQAIVNTNLNADDYHPLLWKRCCLRQPPADGSRETSSASIYDSSSLVVERCFEHPCRCVDSRCTAAVSDFGLA